MIEQQEMEASYGPRGLAGWLLRRLRREVQAPRRLIVVARVSLGPRQSCSLIEADGQRFLLASSADGAPCFQPLAGRKVKGGRISW